MAESKFDKLAGKLGHKKGIDDPAALAAYIGREKFGKEGFQHLAEKGKQRVAKQRKAMK